MRSSAHALAFALVLLASATARAEDLVTPAPEALAEIRVDEKLGAQVPLDLRFRDHTGIEVALGDLVRGDLPVILTFNYSSCSMLCSMQLNGLVEGLGAIDFHPGAQFRVITVVIEPKETWQRAAETRDLYLDKLEKMSPSARHTAQRGGWTFLVASPQGQDASIRHLADSVGFRYRYLPDRAEWAHPAALVFLSATGTVTRYVHGIQYDRDVLVESISRAGVAEPSAAAGFLQRCFHWDPMANSYAQTGRTLMTVGAAIFAGLVLGALLLAHLLRGSSS